MLRFEQAVQPRPDQPDKGKRGAVQAINPFVESYIRRVDDLLTQDDRTVIDAYLQKIILGPDGTKREYDDIAKDVFFMDQDERLAEIQKKLSARVPLSLKDYLITRVDVLLERIPPPGQAPKTPGLRIVKAGKPRGSDFDATVSRPEASGRAEQTGELSHSHESVSSMDLEGLLSDKVIGSIYPKIHCQCDYDFALPDVSGFTHLRPDAPRPEEIRVLPRLTRDDIQRDNLVISLPRGRITGGVLPVPYGFRVRGALEQPIDIVDAGGQSPFRTRLMSEIGQDSLTYVMSFIGDSATVDLKSFVPTEDEREDLQACLPVPEEFRTRGSASLSGAREVINEIMAREFRYVCDDRLGAFIKRHPQDLGLIMEGLKAGHCDLLAWCAAAYYRQLGHAACVVNSEITGARGDGFLRDCTHSRVGVFKPNGAVNYFDATETCRAIEGYALEHTSDGLLAQTEEEYDQAHTREEKLEVLRKLRRHIDESEPLHYAPLYGENAVPSLDKPFDELEDISVTDEDVASFTELMQRNYQGTFTREQRVEMNRLCDKMASLGLPLTLNAIGLIKNRTPIRQLVHAGRAKEVLRSLGSAVFIMEDVLSRISPELVEAAYAATGSDELTDDKRTEQVHPFQDIQSIVHIPDVASMMRFTDDFEPRKLIPGQEYPNGFMHQMFLYNKLMAAAFVDERARRFAQERFGIKEEDLKDYAYGFEPCLSPAAAPKVVATTAREFTGKKTAEDLEKYRLIAEGTQATLTVDREAYRAACASLFRALSSLRLRPGETSWDQGSDVFDAMPVPFDPDRHSADMIDQNASSKAGKLMVRERRVVKERPALYVHMDITSFETYGLNDVSFYARAEVILDTLIKFSKLKKVDVYLSSGNNDYLRISPKLAAQKDLIITRLIRSRIDRLTADNKSIDFGFQTQKGLPKNLLYLSFNQGRVNAVKHVLSRKTNVVAKTFSEVGLDVFPRMRLQDEGDET